MKALCSSLWVGWPLAAPAVPLPPRVTLADWGPSELSKLPQGLSSQPHFLSQEWIVSPWIQRDGKNYRIPLRGGAAAWSFPVSASPYSGRVVSVSKSQYENPKSLVGAFDSYVLNWDALQQNLLLSDSRGVDFWKLEVPGRLVHQNQRLTSAWAVLSLGPSSSLFWIRRDLRSVIHVRWREPSSRWVGVEGCDSSRFLGVERLAGNRYRVSRWTGAKPEALWTLAWNSPTAQSDAAFVWPESCQSLFLGGSFGLMHFTLPSH